MFVNNHQVKESATWILSYGCTSAAGGSSSEFWNSLLSGRKNLTSISVGPVSTNAFQWPSSKFSSHKDRLLEQIRISWREAFANLAPSAQVRVRSGKKLGVILASTKSFVDDVVWNEDADLSQDLLNPLLNTFLKENEISAVKKICVSNACASSLSAAYLAKKWLASDAIDDVVVVAADSVGPFVLNGFNCLKVFSRDEVRPFSKSRSGFFLGDASAVIVFSKHREQSSIQLDGVGIDAEGYAVTRPSQSGDSLYRAASQIPSLKSSLPEVVVAHGTATQINDSIEDQVYQKLFAQAKPPITATKWCVGHTLATSGALDLIAGCEVLKNQKVFHIPTTDEVDPSFNGNYLVSRDQAESVKSISKVMLSSLGFGGIHAAGTLVLENS